MKEYGLVGERLGHSFSPEIHGKLGRYQYQLFQVPPEEIDAFFEKRDFLGLNVTIPYKKTVISHLDEISEAAREIGAVNTVVNENGRLKGYNTDCVGMRDAISLAGIEIKDKKVLICGSGGTSRTALYVAKTMGAREIYCLSRSEKEGFITYGEAAKHHADAQVIINTTPSGMYPDTDGTPIDISLYPQLSGVFDAVFNPLRTALVVAAQKRGVRAAGGLFMLVSQAVRASELFTGVSVPPQKALQIYGELMGGKENIVLVGMPSSGKSSVGKVIAEALGRELADSDALVREKEGMDISEIFALHGEEYFRQAETRAISELSRKNGIVIATGGGAVLREENVDALRRGGKIYFLDRSLEKLTATFDRPLSSSRAALEKRYTERIGIYRAVSDVTVDSNGTVDETAQLILKERQG